MCLLFCFFFFFFFNDTATTEIYTLSLHDALPIRLPLRAQPCSRSPSQVVHARRVVTVEPASLADAPSACEPLREAVPRAIISRQRQDRPVAAVQHALPTEALDHLRGVR